MRPPRSSHPAKPRIVSTEVPRLPLPAVSEASRIVELRCLGDAELDAGRPAEARAFYERAIEQAPLLADLHLRIALCHLHAREPKSASEALRRALFLTPQLWQAWLLLADLAHDPAQARRYLAQARNLLESDAEPTDEPALRAFASDHAVALAAVRHRLGRLR